MPYIFESYKDGLDQQFEVYASNEEECVDLDAMSGGLHTCIKLDRIEVELLHEALGNWLDGLLE